RGPPRRSRAAAWARRRRRRGSSSLCLQKRLEFFRTLAEEEFCRLPYGERRDYEDKKQPIVCVTQRWHEVQENTCINCRDKRTDEDAADSGHLAPMSSRSAVSNPRRAHCHSALGAKRLRSPDRARCRS